MLDHLGYDERWERLFQPFTAQGLVPGRVARVDRGSSLVMTADGIVRAAPSPHLLKSVSTTGLPVVGDWVALRPPRDAGGEAVVEEVLPRASVFTRSDPGKAIVAQLVAANIDTVFVVHTLSRELNLRRLERELVLAWESGATPVVVLTKADLCPDVHTTVAQVETAIVGTRVHAVSSVTGTGVDGLLAHAGRGQTVALIGASGVGKSTLINRMVGAEVQATGEVRASDGKGRHVTVARELVLLPAGGVLVDTPGMRALALWQAEEGMAQAFADVEALARSCRFRDCTHAGEPGCAVLAAVAAGSLPQRRLDSYRSLLGELAFLEAKHHVRVQNEQKRKLKLVHKTTRGSYRKRKR